MVRRFNPFLLAILLGPTSFITAQQLKVVLEAPAKVVGKQTKNIFKVSLSNVSTRNIWIYKDLSKGLEIWVKNEAGKDLEPTFIGALCPPPPPTSEHFLCLKPGQAVSNIDDRSPSELGVKNPGSFTAIAAYYYQVEVRSDGKKILHLVEKAVESAPIKFKVH